MSSDFESNVWVQMEANLIPDPDKGRLGAYLAIVVRDVFNWMIDYYFME